MSDLISRQDAIDAIREYIEEYSSTDANGNHNQKWCAMKEAEQALKDLPSANQWIPYNKQLPQKIDTYIVCASTGSVFLSRWEGSAFSTRGKIIAWMKRPKAYDKKEEK